MKFTIEKKAFASALAHVARVVEARNAYPILANVLLTADGDGITLRATDLDIEITEPVAANVSEHGATAVPARMLNDIVRKVSDGAEITFEETDNSAVLKAGRSRFNLSCLAADSFPDLKAGEFTHSFSMPAATLARIISKTQFAISTEETRYYLNGIYFHTIANDAGATVLRGVATDGHRMARAECEAPDGAEGMPGIIIPKKTVAEVQKLLPDGGDVTVDVMENKIRFTIGSVVLLSKLIEGTFPDYQRVTPMGNNKLITLSKAELSKAVDRVGTVASDRGGKAVKLAFDAGTLTLEVTNADHGAATEDLAAGGDIGAFEIGFNTKYLLDVVSQIDSAEVEFAFNESGSPSLVRDASAGADCLYVLMPMRV